MWSDGGQQSPPRPKVSLSCCISLKHGLLKKINKKSFWFLFPVANYDPLAIEDVVGSSGTCFGCDSEFSDVRLSFFPACIIFEKTMYR